MVAFLCGGRLFHVLSIAAFLVLLNLSLAVTTALAQQSEFDTITGFRSAQFGKSKADIRAAIASDFGLTGAAIGEGTNAIERTANLSIIVDDLIPENGPAAIVYIFGFRSEALIQVNINWGSPAEENPDLDRLISATRILQRHFVSKDYPPENEVVNVPVGTGAVVAYQGSDERGRTIVLTLNTPQSSQPTDDGGTIDASDIDTSLFSLALRYISDPNEPDVFRLEEGSF
ncbi:MAG: hypothetical protein O7C63_08655 [Alphaproteobacteria bacterium]|nr:hypothetical protein [Alphaproteobacteria bacterium]